MSSPKEIDLVKIIGLLCFLAIFLSNVKGEVWIKSCQTSKNACDNACQVHRPVYWTCHHETGYCLCPPRATPGDNCRAPRWNSTAEWKDCTTAICQDLKRSDYSHKDKHGRLPSTFGKKNHPSLFNLGKKVAKAMVCIPDEDDKAYKTLRNSGHGSGGGLSGRHKSFVKEIAYCACFMVPQGDSQHVNAHKKEKETVKFARNIVNIGDYRHYHPPAADPNLNTAEIP